MTHTDQQDARIFSDDGRKAGIWSRMRDRVWGPAEEFEEEEIETPERVVRVAVRQVAATLNDARQAADGLKSGQQQIVNLEHAAQDMAERIFDFLNGVTYALDGTVERIGDRVYLFAPADVEIESDSAIR